MLYLIRSTAGRQIQNPHLRENWAWIQTGSKNNYGVLHGHLLRKVQALLKVQVPSIADVQQLAAMQITKVKSGNHPNAGHGLVLVVKSPPKDQSTN